MRRNRESATKPLRHRFTTEGFDSSPAFSFCGNVVWGVECILAVIGTGGPVRAEAFRHDLDLETYCRGVEERVLQALTNAADALAAAAMEAKARVKQAHAEGGGCSINKRINHHIGRPECNRGPQGVHRGSTGGPQGSTR
eukprot:1183711-Prorocentrum_minimum.AAC.3